MDLNEITNQLSEGTWLGRLDDVNAWFAVLRPVAELVEGAWVKVENGIEKFPTQGCVTAKKGDLSPAAVSGSLWVFGCRPSGMDRHRSLALDLERAIPIVDLSLSSLSDARQKLLEFGISLPEHQGRQALVLLPGDTYCTLRFEPHGRLFLARLPLDGIVELRKADPTWKDGYRDRDALFLPRRGTPNDEVVGRVDWSSDRDFVLKVLKRYRAAVSAFCEFGEKTPEPEIRKLERALANGRLTGTETLELEAVVQRMRSEWADTSRALAAVDEMGEFLLQSELGKRLLQKAVERRSETLVAEIESELRSEVDRRLSSGREALCTLEDETSNATARLDGLRNDISVLTTEKQDTDEALRKARTELQVLKANAEEQRRAVEQLQALKVDTQGGIVEATARHDALIARIESMLATVVEFQERAQEEFEATGANNESAVQALAARLETYLKGGADRVPPLLPSATPPWWCSPSADGAQEISADELGKRLADEAVDHGVLAEDVRALDLFARSGELVLLFGDQTEQALCAYARAVSGGKIRTHALDPSVIGLDDLWRVPTSGRPTAFAQAWHRAQVRSDTVVLLCLRDLDASPFHLWLASLAATLRSPYRPRNLLFVATVTGVSAQDDEYPGAETLRRHLVALEPRADPRAHLSEIVLNGEMAPPTLLQASWESEGISQSTLRAIAQSGRATEIVRRALNLCRTANDAPPVSATGLASVWSQYLVDCRPEALPPALSSAHSRLKTLHIQR